MVKRFSAVFCLSHMTRIRNLARLNVLHLESWKKSLSTHSIDDH